MNIPDNSQPFQKILENIKANGDIKVGDITQIYKITLNLDNIPKPKSFPQNIIPSSTDKFIGREKELENLHQQLQNQNTMTINAVEGMGGIGKTELAIQYSLLHLQLNTYPGGICWIRCRKQDISSQIISFARTDLGLQIPKDLEPTEKVRWCWKNWPEGNTLIVLDDVKNYEDIRLYLPPQPSQFKVLITTRLKLDLPNPLNLEVLPELKALELLSELIGSERVSQELETAKEICQFLGYLPLALQLVGRHIKTYRNILLQPISLPEELNNLRTKRLADPALQSPTNKGNQVKNIELGVQAAFELSWERLSNTAQELGCLLSLFALAPIPPKLVKNITVKQNQDEDTTVAAISELANLHLLEIQNNYQFHQLIQEFFRNKQRELVITNQQKSQLCTTIANIRKETRQDLTLKSINDLTPFIPHLTEVVTIYEDYLKDEDLIWPFVELGRFYQGQGAYAQALPWREKCISAAEKRFGEEHSDVAQSLNNLAELYHEQGRYEDAEPLYLKALEMREKLLGEEHPDVAESLNNLALLYNNQERYEDAESYYLKALEMRKKLLEEEHPDIAISLNNLALLYHSQNGYEKAEPLYLEALQIGEKTLGKEHLAIARRLNNLARLYNDQGRYEKAETLHLRALEMRKKLLGEEHPDVAQSLNNLAKLYHDQGRYKDAEPLYQQALKIYKKKLGENHRRTINCQKNYQLLKTSW